MKRIKSDNSEPELSFYTFLKADTFNYEEFKENAIKRAKLLKRIENNIFDFSAVTTKEEDVNTHFSLRLICAQAKSSILWFITQETQLFKYRLKSNIDQARSFFIEEIWPKLNVKDNIEYKTIYNPQHHNTTPFRSEIKVHFAKCSEIIAKRQQIPYDGYLNFDNDVMVTFLVETFRNWLSKQMEDVYEKSIRFFDHRLINLNKILFSSNEASQENINVKNILENTELFPLCIKGLIERLKTNNHLKYNDRQVLCLFLKSIGMSLSDCIDFFRSNFKVTQNEFDKQYMYNIRHNYGLEGKRANYQSFPCSKIIGFSNDGISFGCPFINNHDFVKINSDIEDISRDAFRCCSKVGSKVLNKELNKPFNSPAEYFKILYEESEQNKK